MMSGGGSMFGTLKLLKLIVYCPSRDWINRMARSRSPPTRHPARLSVEDVGLAVTKLRRGVEELNAIDVATMRERCEPRFTALEQFMGRSPGVTPG
jgi:hypothetical protein